MKNIFDISIILLTYNQENFVLEAIDSVLMQNFNGLSEIIVCDDASEDSTYPLLEDKLRKVKNVTLLKNEKNLGLAKNYEQAFSLAKGSYIAYLEGDDYWTDPFKIQKQFDSLESKPNYSIAFHDFILINDKSEIIDYSNLSKNSIKQNRSKSDMVEGCLIHQNTIMYRRCFDMLPKGFYLAKNHDSWLLAYLSNFGEAKYVECKPLHYRISSNSLWSSLSNRKKHQNGLVTCFFIFPYVSLKFYPILIKKIIRKVIYILKSYVDY